MLAIQVELLRGVYAASAHNDRRRAEWPPHPARFFSALVAALHYHDPEPADDGERAALLWLESQGPPALDVEPPSHEVNRRDVRDVYVPVNDVSVFARQEANLAEMPRRLTKKDMDSARALLPAGRTRKARTFPVVYPDRPVFHFVWPDADPSRHYAALERLCARVTRLGHSSSLVRCALVRDIVDPALVPSETGTVMLRVVSPGQVDRLEREYARHQGVEGRVLPAVPQRYGPPSTQVTEDPPRSVFSSEWIVFERLGGARLFSSRGPELTRALRAALLEIHGEASVPAWLSGHEADGSIATSHHVAFLALPFVGHPHADGSIQGCAVVLPRGFGAAERETLFRLVAQWERERGLQDLTLGGTTFPSLQIRRTELSEKDSLDVSRWSRPARSWVTALPIALDRNPGNLRSNVGRTAHKAACEAQTTIMDACERLGLPRPANIEISQAPLLAGAQPVAAFAPWPPPARMPRTLRVRVHAAITFAQAVEGPLILGAGRFFGLGLCLPVPEGL